MEKQCCVCQSKKELGMYDDEILGELSVCFSCYDTGELADWIKVKRMKLLRKEFKETWSIIKG
jgi:hypothetical protein